MTENAPESSQHLQAGDRDEKGRYKPGVSGNWRGKKRGTRHRATRLAEALLAGEVDGIVGKTVELALAGDTTALGLCLARLCPVRREAPVRVYLPPIVGPADVPAALADLLAAVAAGQLTIGEGERLARLVGAFQQAYEIVELTRRVDELEQAIEDAL